MGKDTIQDYQQHVLEGERVVEDMVMIVDKYHKS